MARFPGSVDAPARASRLTRHVLIAATAALIATTAITGTTLPTEARFVDRDCSDFATQAKAQKFYKKAGGPKRDPHGLDSDHDGKACESLPR